MKTHVILFTLATTLPTAALAVGWVFATEREQALQEKTMDQRLLRAADSVRVAVDESLEELRQREDRRPFYLYNYYYSPPDTEVKSVTDPVAVSPLARDLEDARVVGHFQVDPDGNVRSPMMRNPSDEGSPAARRVLAALESDRFAPLRDLRRAVPDSSLLAALPPAAVVTTRRVRTRTRPRMEERAAEPNLDPQGPLTVSLNVWGNNVYDEIEAAQAGDTRANARLQSRGRSAPQTRRASRSWNEFGQPETVQQAALPANIEPRQQASPPLPPQMQAMQASPPQMQSTRPRMRAARREEVREVLVPVNCDSPDELVDPMQCVPERAALVSQREADVGYTTMAWRPVGNDLILHRVVDHEGAIVVQGALLDLEHLRTVWIPGLVARHGVALIGETPVTPTVEGAGSSAVCALRQPVSEVLELDLCFPQAAIGAVLALNHRSHRVQMGMLLGLLLIVTFAVFLMVRAAQHAEELSRQKSAFVSAVSHELRTPLTTIRMHSEMLQEDLVSDARRPKVYEEITQESIRLGRLVENVLELSRLEEGARPLRRSEGDMRSFLRELAEGQRAHVERHGFAFEGPAAGDPVVFSFDPQALEQITLNLIENALKYGRGEILRLGLDVGSDAAGRWLEVRDWGPGIPADERTRVLQRFHRVEADATKHMPGTGIGLALVSELVGAHGGSVSISDHGGVGCIVRATFP